MANGDAVTSGYRIARALRRNARSIASGVLVVLTIVGLLASTAAFWARSVVFEEERWIATIRDLPKQEAVAVALADYLTEQLFVAIDFEDRVQEALPDEVAVIVPILTSAIEGFVADEATKLIESDKFQRLWIAANREAHRVLMALLDERPLIPGLERTDDTITLNLIPAVNSFLDQIGDVAGDVVGTDLAVPEIPDDATTRDAIRELSERLGVDLPDDFAQITVYQGDRLPQPRDTVVFLERVRVLAAVATFVLGVLAVVVSPSRRRTILGLLGGSAVGFALLLTVPGVVGDQIGRLIHDGTDRAAAREAIHVVFESYATLYRWLVAVSLFAAAMILVTGPSRVARRARVEVRTRVDRFAIAAVARQYLERSVVWLRFGGPVVGMVFVLAFTRRSLTAWFVLFALVAAWESLLSLVPGDRRTHDQSETTTDHA